MEHNGPELELLQLQIKALAKPYLPAFSFVVGILLTYVVLRLLPGYDETCSSINETLHAPLSIVELPDHKFTPGEFPVTPSRRMIDELRDLLLTKDKQIATLRNDLEQEDEELVDLLAQKDEEISGYQTALQQRDKRISDLQAVKATPTQQPTPALDEHTQELQKQLKAALACKAELEQSVAKLAKETDVLKKESSNWRSRRNGPSLPPQSYVFKEFRDQIIALERQVSQRDLEAANARQSSTAKYNQRVSALEAELSQRDVDAANARQSLTAQYDQRVQDLGAQLSQHGSVAAANAQQLTAHHNQQVSSLQTVLSEGNLRLANAQQANGTLQNQLLRDRSALADMKKEFDSRAQRLDYLESQCVKADALYAEYQKLVKAFNDLKAQGEANAPTAELHAAREHIAELTRSKHQLEKKLKDPRETNAVYKITLENMERDFAKTRTLLQDNLDAIRVTGGPSSGFLKMHHDLQQERDSWRVKCKTLEGKFYAMEIRAANLTARERTLNLQLQRYKQYSSAAAVNAGTASSSQEREIDMTSLHEIQKERDAVNHRYEELVTRSQEILEAALGSVDWQLDGATAEEREQRCKDLGEDLGTRIKPLLEKIGCQVEKIERDAKAERARLETEQMLRDVKLAKIASLEGMLAAETASAKRKGGEGGEGEPQGKRQHHE